MKTLNDATIIVCSIVRNASRGLKKNIPIINAICDQAKDYKVIVYENDSSDDTQNILQEWVEERGKEKIHALLNNTDPDPTIPSARSTNANPFFCKKRIGKMARLRNNYMEYMEKNNWVADYLIVVDLDVEKICLEGVLSAFQTKLNWDAITAFGYSLSPKFKIRYHDTYALVENGKENVPQTESDIYGLPELFGKIRHRQELYPVFSAFGGLSIYRFEAIKGLHYQTLDNDDNRVEVRCEHYSLYKQMHERGYNHIFISPQMTLKYQRLSFALIWNTLKRHLKLD